jgi:hypothetical protein
VNGLYNKFSRAEMFEFEFVQALFEFEATSPHCEPLFELPPAIHNYPPLCLPRHQQSQGLIYVRIVVRFACVGEGDESHNFSNILLRAAHVSHQHANSVAAPYGPRLNSFDL